MLNKLLSIVVLLIALIAALMFLPNSQPLQWNQNAVAEEIVLDANPCSATNLDGVPPNGLCASTLPASGPIVVGEDNVVIENVDIFTKRHDQCALEVMDRKNITIRNVNIRHTGAGICVFRSENVTIQTVRLVNTIQRAGPHCRPGISVDECKNVHRRKQPDKLYSVNTHNNIWVQESDNVVIDTVYVEKGEAGIFSEKNSKLAIKNLHCRDIRGPYWRGQCVQILRSDGASVANFYAQQFLETSSGHDNFNVYESSDVSFSDGLIDGNWSRNGVGVIADSEGHNVTVKDVDIVNNGNAGVNVWSGATKDDDGRVGKNFTVDGVRVRGGHCDVTWHNRENYGPSSGGMAFAMHPAAKGARYINSQYWDHCREHAVFEKTRPAEFDIKQEEFELKAPPINIHFPWLVLPN